ncbi:spike base protein, RCAP_Rcc01079 family [Profundibacter sp.]
MVDDFSSYMNGLTAPATDAAALIPSDTVALVSVTRAVFVGSAGDLRVTMLSGDVVVLSNVAAGMVYPLRVSHVMATGTTAGGLVGLS